MFFPELNPILSLINFHQATLAGFISNGGSDLTGAAAASRSSGRYQTQIGIINRAVVRPPHQRPSRERGNAYIAPNALNRVRPLGTFESFDCKPVGRRGEGPDDGRSRAAKAPPPCFVAPPSLYSGKRFNKLEKGKAPNVPAPQGQSPATPQHPNRVATLNGPQSSMPMPFFFGWLYRRLGVVLLPALDRVRVLHRDHHHARDGRPVRALRGHVDRHVLADPRRRRGCRPGGAGLHGAAHQAPGDAGRAMGAGRAAIRPARPTPGGGRCRFRARWWCATGSLPFAIVGIPVAIFFTVQLDLPWYSARDHLRGHAGGDRLRGGAALLRLRAVPAAGDRGHQHATCRRTGRASRRACRCDGSCSARCRSST